MAIQIEYRDNFLVYHDGHYAYYKLKDGVLTSGVSNRMALWLEEFLMDKEWDEKDDIRFQMLEYLRNYTRQWERKGLEPTFGGIWDMIRCLGKEELRTQAELTRKETLTGELNES